MLDCTPHQVDYIDDRIGTIEQRFDFAIDLFHRDLHLMTPYYYDFRTQRRRGSSLPLVRVRFHRLSVLLCYYSRQPRPHGQNHRQVSHIRNENATTATIP
jgi:hypothetical protein